MNLHEYQAKQLFAHYGLPIPIGYVCNSPCEAVKVASKINSSFLVVKCQIHANGRCKAGGVKIVKSKEEVRAFAECWIGKRLVTYQTNTSGQLVNKILVEEATDIIKEFYLSVIIDSYSHRVVFIASTEGGIEIEKTTKKTTCLIHKVYIDPLTGPMPYQGRELAFNLGLNGKLVQQFTKIFINLITIFLDYDLTLVEINPLAITSQGNLICLDGKMTVDSYALFRQPELRKMCDRFQEDPLEFLAAQWKLNYVSLNGNIGCMVNGAGLAMSTMDIIKLYGGELANFLDVGGSVTKERVIKGFKIIVSDNNVKTILVNIFGGIVRCDLIAEGIINAMKKMNINLPVIVRMEGNNAEIGVKKLINSNLKIIVTKSLTDAINQVISIVKDRNVYINR